MPGPAADGCQPLGLFEWTNDRRLLMVGGSVDLRQMAAFSTCGHMYSRADCRSCAVEDARRYAEDQAYLRHQEHLKQSEAHHREREENGERHAREHQYFQAAPLSAPSGPLFTASGVAAGGALVILALVVGAVVVAVAVVVGVVAWLLHLLVWLMPLGALGGAAYLYWHQCPRTDGFDKVGWWAVATLPSGALTLAGVAGLAVGIEASWLLILGSVPLLFLVHARVDPVWLVDHWPAWATAR